MCSIVLSIKPEFAKKIFSGEKRYEFRRIVAKHAVDRIVIYETSPTMSVTGEVEVKELISDSLESLWAKVSEFAGVSKEFFDQYFQGLEKGSAYCLGEPITYKTERALSDFGVSAPPQSFCYISDLGTDESDGRSLEHV